MMRQFNRITIILTFLIISLTGTPGLEADSQFDILPLGPSKYKFKIARVEQNKIIRTASAETVNIRNIIEQNPKADVFVIGEAHDNYDCHIFQRDFIEALQQKYPKLIVGFEFFWREDNEFLEQWRTGNISETELLEKVGWYKRGGMNYGYTRLIMNMIKKNKLKVIGLNVPRTILRTISRKGYDNITAEQKKLFPTIHIPNPEHEYFIKSIFGMMALQVPMWFTNIYSAQKAWDVIMAESMRQMLSKKEYKGYKGVIIAGNNHVAYKLGIPFRYKKADRRARIVTISPILLPRQGEEKDADEEAHPMMKMMAKNMKPSALFSRGIADYVFAATQPKYNHFPVIGFSIKDDKEKLTITTVKKKSIAEKYGLRKGDQITSIDGVTVTSKAQFRTLLAQKKWDETFTMGVIKALDLKKEENKEKKKKGMMKTDMMKNKKKSPMKKSAGMN